MVGAWDPKHISALLPVKPAQNVLQGQIQGMAHMQLARDIGRWNNDTVGFFLRRGVRGKGLVLLPVPKPSVFYISGLIALGQRMFCHDHSVIKKYKKSNGPVYMYKLQCKQKKIVSSKQTDMTVCPQQQNRPCIAQKNPAPVALV
jgi:hypothetical protein